MKQIIAVFGIFTVGAVGQTLTTIGGQQMGETVQRFMAVAHGADYVAQICKSHKRTDKLECRALTDLADGKPGVLHTNDDDRDYHWRFVHGRLYELNITPRRSLNTEREIELLVQTYGPPTERKTVVFQNAYGARWECPEALWSMPDGISISASEYIGSRYSGTERRILISFMSKEAIADAEREMQPKPNPYRSPK